MAPTAITIVDTNTAVVFGMSIEDPKNPVVAVAEVPPGHVHGDRFETGRAQRSGVTGAPPARGVDRRRAEQADDVNVAVVEQVADSKGGPGRVVDNDAGSHLIDPPVDEDHGAEVARSDAPDERVAQQSAGDDQPVDATLLEQSSEDLLAGAFHMGAEHDSVAELMGSLFGAGDDVGVHRVGHARHEHAHRPGAGHAEPAGDHVGPVVELAHGVDDALARVSGRPLPWDRR